MYFRSTGKYSSREVTGDIIESAPSAPLAAFFLAGAETYYFKFQGGHMHICPTAAHASGPIQKRSNEMYKPDIK